MLSYSRNLHLQMINQNARPCFFRVELTEVWNIGEFHKLSQSFLRLTSLNLSVVYPDIRVSFYPW